MKKQRIKSRMKIQVLQISHNTPELYPYKENKGTTRDNAKEKSFDLRGIQTHDVRIRSNVGLPTKLRDMIRETSGNFTSRQGVYSYFFLSTFIVFSLTFKFFGHFTDMNHVVLVEYCSWNWTTIASWWVFKKINPLQSIFKYTAVADPDHQISRWGAVIQTLR